MKYCPACGTENREPAKFCEECGEKFAAEPIFDLSGEDAISVTQTPVSPSGTVTSVGVPALAEANGKSGDLPALPTTETKAGVHSVLIIERGGAANTEFALSGEESQIGRWDADNGIFPDVDLDPFDADAKVSRRHARVIYRGGVFVIEDLGSTNGTFVNRGRRLLPGIPQVLSDGDEIIVGKTFLRFRIK